MDERELLTEELDHFCIGWIKLEPVKLAPKLTITSGASAILTEDAHKETLCRILESVTPEPKLTLQHTMAQGADGNSFNTKMKGKGRILVLVQSSEGHIFGGFVHDVHGTRNTGFQCNPGNFMFALGNKTGVPLKLIQPPGYTGIGFHDYCGFHMGGSSAFDLQCFCSSCCYKPEAYTVSAPGFATVPLDEGTLCGTPGTASFKPTVMEVYQVQ